MRTWAIIQIQGYAIRNNTLVLILGEILDKKLCVWYEVERLLYIGDFKTKHHANSSNKQPYTAHVSTVQLKMVDQTWISEVWKKPVTVRHRLIPNKSLLLQWLFNLPLVAQ